MTTPRSTIPHGDDYSTSRKHSMDYFTVDGITLRTGYSDKEIWYLVCIRELLDNAADFLWKHYGGSNNAAIIVEIHKTDTTFKLKVRNSNDNDIPVFSDYETEAIFDFDGRYGSKQDVHMIFRGMLGDALKQILAFGYALLHSNDDGTAFVDKQWEHPLIIRHNKIECKYLLKVDMANQDREVKLIDKREFTGIGLDTETELMLPIIDEVNLLLTRTFIEQFCRKYPIFTTDISFKFSIIDDSSTLDSTFTIDGETYKSKTEEHNVIAKGFAMSLIEGPPRAKKVIEFPALHPISKDNWNKTDCIKSYKPEEVSRRILNVRDKEVIVYDILHKWREGTNLAKSEDNLISVKKLLAMSAEDRGKKIEQYYNELKYKLPQLERVSLPHTRNKNERTRTLMARVANLYDIDKNKQPVYKAIDGYYKDGVIEFPFYFEIFAVPFTRELIRKNVNTVFIGAVNYSISPKESGNIFEGHYEWFNEKGYPRDAKDIIGVLEENRFSFHYAGPNKKIPCVIIANLVTQRRDPHGQDKSRIDTRPFTEVIAEAVRKLAMTPGIQTYRADGWTFNDRDEEDISTATQHEINPGEKKGIEPILRQFLIEERGLPR